MKSRTKEIRIRVKDIIIPDNHRPLNKEKLPIIADSMREIGLKISPAQNEAVRHRSRCALEDRLGFYASRSTHRI